MRKNGQGRREKGRLLFWENYEEGNTHVKKNTTNIYYKIIYRITIMALSTFERLTRYAMRDVITMRRGQRCEATHDEYMYIYIYSIRVYIYICIYVNENKDKLLCLSKLLIVYKESRLYYPRHFNYPRTLCLLVSFSQNKALRLTKLASLF